jgi:hypothetical protein
LGIAGVLSVIISFAADKSRFNFALRLRYALRPRLLEVLRGVGGF